MSDNRPIVYVDSRDGESFPVYRASSIGRALRCLTLARIEETPKQAPEYLQKAAAEGHRYEPIVKKIMVEMGWRIEGEQDEVEVRVDLSHLSVEYPYAVIRGHLDSPSCIAPDDPTDTMLEVKSMSQGVWEKWRTHRFLAFPPYSAQLTIYMYATGKPATYAVINRETGELEILRFDTPPMEIDALFGKIKLVEQFAMMDQLPVCDNTSYQCAYSYRCDKGATSEIDTSGAMARLVSEYLAAKKVEDDAGVEVKRVRKLIEAQMKGVDKTQVPGATVSWQKPSRQLDRERVALAMEEAGLDINSYYSDGTGPKHLVIRPTTTKRESKRDAAE